MSTHQITVSTVTPVYAGQDYLAELVTELEKLRAHWADTDAPLALVESIFVDDGSIDASASILAELAAKHDWVKVISLSRNYGQHSATVAGICHTSSDWVVTLDEDMQHRPSLIPNLFETQVEESADVVYARPVNAVHGESWRDKCSRLVKVVLAKLTSTPQIQLFNSFRLIRGSIARAAASSSSSNTYFDIAVSWFTKSCAAIEVELFDDRFIEKRESGYGLIKLIRHARKLVLSSELDIASSGMILGFLTVSAATLIALVSLVTKLLFPASVAMTGWTSLIVVVTFFSGVIIALLCIALEYLNIIVLNNLGRPAFFTVDRSQDILLKQWIATRTEP